jgi:hypothetical protein
MCLPVTLFNASKTLPGYRETSTRSRNCPSCRNRTRTFVDSQCRSISNPTMESTGTTTSSIVARRVRSFITKWFLHMENRNIGRPVNSEYNTESPSSTELFVQSLRIANAHTAQSPTANINTMMIAVRPIVAPPIVKEVRHANTHPATHPAMARNTAESVDNRVSLIRSRPALVYWIGKTGTVRIPSSSG